MDIIIWLIELLVRAAKSQNTPTPPPRPGLPPRQPQQPAPANRSSDWNEIVNAAQRTARPPAQPTRTITKKPLKRPRPATMPVAAPIAAPSYSAPISESTAPAISTAPFIASAAHPSRARALMGSSRQDLRRALIAAEVLTEPAGLMFEKF